MERDTDAQEPQERPAPTAPTPPQRKPKRLGKDLEYYEDRVIGQGVFGVVYYGQTRSEGFPLAVKLVRDMPSNYSRTSMANIAGFSDDDLRASHGPSGAKEGGDAGRGAPPSPPGRDKAAAYPEEIKVLTELKGVGCPNIISLHSSWNRKKDKARDRHESPGAGQQRPAFGGSLYRRSDREFLVVTEYCAGGDLLTLQRRSRTRFSEAAGRSLIYQLCNALWVLYQKKIIHRDIKPANLLLTSTDPARAVLKLADWGMAKSATNTDRQQLRDADYNDDPMQGGGGMFYSHVGTPMYKSPERIRQQPYSYKADVYSAGMVLYELMTGSTIRARTQEDLLEAVPRAVRHLYRKHEKIAATADAPAAPPPLWVDLVKGMTETDPNERLSIEEVLLHPWFRPENGPPLPALTLPLTRSAPAAPPPPLPSLPATVAAVDLPLPTAPPEELSGGEEDVGSPTGPRTARCHMPGGSLGGPSRQQQLPPCPAPPSIPPSQPPLSPTPRAASPPSFSQRQSPFMAFSNANWWTVLAAPPTPCTAANLSPFLLSHHHGSQQQQQEQQQQQHQQLPGECGPHIITHTVKHYVRTILDCALTLDEARSGAEGGSREDWSSAPPPQAVEALTLLAFSKELLTVGYAAFAREVELHGCLMPPPAEDERATAGTPTTAATAPSKPGNVPGAELWTVSREYSELYGVWEGIRAEVEERVRTTLTVSCSAKQREELQRMLTSRANAQLRGVGKPGDSTRGGTAACAEAILLTKALRAAMSCALEDRVADEADRSSENETSFFGEMTGEKAEDSACSAGGDTDDDDEGEEEEEREPIPYIKARAILRVMLQQAVLTESEVGHVYSGAGEPEGGDSACRRLYLIHVPLLPAPQERSHVWGGNVVDQLMDALVAYALSKRNRRPWEG